MQKILSKAIAIMLIAILVGFNCITTSVYAVNIIEQNNETSEKNITFDVKIGNESSDKGYEYTADIDSTDTNLYLNIGVKNTGYLKNIVINLENSNYKFDTSKVSDSRIKNITDYTVELNQINTGRTVELAIPILPLKEDTIAQDILGKESLVKFNATYINEDNKEKTLEKEMIVHLNWTATNEALVPELSQEVIRYLNYNGKTMVSFLLSDGLKDSKLPVSSKAIQIKVPTIKELKPSNVIVTAINTLATNGKADGVDFTKDNYSYNNNEGILTINTENLANEEGKVAWNKGGKDKFVITYIYETNTNEEPIDVHTETQVQTTLLNGATVSANMEVQDYSMDSKIGDIATVEVVPQTDKLNKGYMYSNKNAQDKKETEFNVKYKLNVGLAEALNEINIKENGDFFDDINASDNIYNKKVSISLEEFVKIFGETGKIDVKKADGTVIGTLNKDTLEIEINDSNITFVTSKPQTEGEINLNITKAIKGDLSYTKEQIAKFRTINTKLQINAETVGTIALEEPTSKVNVTLSNTNLSTVVKNENIVMNIELERDDITDNLFANPELKITFPEEVTNIEAKDATLLYEDELKSEELQVEGRTLSLKLNGEQTQYTEQSTAKGTVIRLVLNVTLNNLAPSNQTNVVVSFTNDNDTLIKNASEISTLSNEETSSVSVPVNVVAPTGFVTTHSISGYNGDESVTAQESEAIGNLPVLSGAKTATISGTVVNNLGSNAEGLKVLGRIPFKGNKNVDSSQDLGTTFDTTLVGKVNVDNLKVIVYYSANGEANTNLDDENNGWSPEYIENAKSFMIVANNAVENRKTFSFSYNINIPANIDYANIAKASYGIYYNNNAQEGNNQNLVMASNVGVKTDDIPNLTTSIKITESNSNKEISNGGNVNSGIYVNAQIVVKNTGKEAAKNVKSTLIIPSGCTLINEISDIEWVIDENKQKEFVIGEIAPNAEITVNSKIFIELDNIEGNTISLRAETKADNIKETSVGTFNMISIGGTLNLTLQSNSASEKLKVGEEFTNALIIENYSDYTKRNVEIVINLPEEITFVSSNTDVKYEGNRITFKIDSIEQWGGQRIEFVLKLNKEDNYKEVNIQAEANYDNILLDDDGNEQVEKDKSISNTTKFNIGKNNVFASFSSNIAESEFIDTDSLEYYVEVTNNSNKNITVNISDILPSELYCKEYIIDNNGKIQTKTQATNSVGLEEILEPGKVLKLTIKAKAYTLNKGEYRDIENKPTILVDNEEIVVQSIKHRINGTGIYNSDDIDNEENSVPGTYRISGVVWIDENKDGKKQEQERRIENIDIILYNKEGFTVSDANNVQIKAKTDKNGQYALENIPSGEYIVIAKYDTKEYIVTDYLKEGLSNNENSDFVDATLDGNPVAATNILKITNANIYNNDLGLQEREEFDLKLDKIVSKVTVTNTMLEPKTNEYNSNFAMVSLYNTYIEYSTVLVEYNITITNEGKVAGYAEEIIDYIPEGMAFSSDLNPNWYVGADGNLYTTSLANTIINPGESKVITLTLTRRMTGENVGTVVNTAEISKTYNEYGLADGDSTPGNRKDGEDDISTATVLLAMSTGREVASFIGITIGVIAIIGLAVFVIKKHIITRI